MANTKPIRIDPIAVQKSSGVGQSRAASSTFGDVLSVAGAFAPLAGELTYQSTGSSNAAAVLHSAFSSFSSAGRAAGLSGGGMMGMGMEPGIMGSARYAGYGMTDAGMGGDIPGMGSTTQAELLDTMNTNNLQLLELQATMQNNMQQWTTKSNILKATHDARMAMIQHFAPRG